MKEKILLILAAGMGSRFGGLKQIEPFGKNGEYIIDYSIYDAIRCGFNKVVFVIKKEHYKIFKDTVGKRVEKHIQVEYAVQTVDEYILKYPKLKERIKPLGTAHAVLSAKNKLNGNFLMINSDDFYGYEAYKKASEFMEKENENIGIIGFKVKNTLSDKGSVKRGVIEEKNNKLIKLVESSIIKKEEEIFATPILEEKTSKIDANTLVSMNMIAFPKGFIKYIEEHIHDFLENQDILKDEFLIPDLISKSVKENKYIVDIIATDSKWVGVTYKEDKEMVKSYIDSLIEENKYKENLWN